MEAKAGTSPIEGRTETRDRIPMWLAISITARPSRAWSVVVRRLRLPTIVQRSRLWGR